MEKYETIDDAVMGWVREFNRIPTRIITLCYGSHDGWMFEEVEHLTASEDGLAYALPSWGTVWTFNSKLDEDWAERNIQTMKDCGFEVYRSDDLGLFFGIDGGGYDFHEHHWKPLYIARGLQWHCKGGRENE